MAQPKPPSYVVFRFNGEKWDFHAQTTRKTNLLDLSIDAYDMAYGDHGSSKSTSRSYKLVPVNDN